MPLFPHSLSRADGVLDGAGRKGEEIQEGERKGWRKEGRRGERPLVESQWGSKKRKEATEPTAEGPSRGLRQEPGKPWGAGIGPGVPTGRQRDHRCLGLAVEVGGFSHHKQGPGTGLTRAEVRGQRT